MDQGFSKQFLPVLSTRTSSKRPYMRHLLITVCKSSGKGGTSNRAQTRDKCGVWMPRANPLIETLSWLAIAAFRTSVNFSAEKCSASCFGYWRDHDEHLPDNGRSASRSAVCAASKPSGHYPPSSYAPPVKVVAPCS